MEALAGEWSYDERLWKLLSWSLTLQKKAPLNDAEVGHGMSYLKPGARGC